jgi:aminoglycoside phosphotransferase (APT) family kinase protein
VDSDLRACLPEALRGAATRIERIAPGMSGAGVYRVDAEGKTYVLKIAGGLEPFDDWKRATQVLAAAGRAGVAPGVVHVDESRTAVVMEFIQGEPFMPAYFSPDRRRQTLDQLADTLRRVHAIPVAPEWARKDTLAAMGYILAGLQQGGGVPAFAAEAIRRIQAQTPPPWDRPLVLSHNDLNPTNLVFAGGRLMLIDWDQARPNEPYYDLAGAALFLRMDDAHCLALLSAYEQRPVTVLPERFQFNRRLAAGFCGLVFLHLARAGGGQGPTGQTLEQTPSLAEAFGQVRERKFNLSQAEDRWSFGLAFLKESLAL